MLRFRAADAPCALQSLAVAASLRHAMEGQTLAPIFFDTQNNAAEVGKVLKLYFVSHQHATSRYSAVPEFFLVEPAVLQGIVPNWESDKLIFNDCVKTAQARNGKVAVFKRTKEGLSYCWFELIPMPFMLGDALSEHNNSILYFLVREFLRFSSKHSQRYGNLLEGVERDPDLGLILQEVNRKANDLERLSGIYCLADLLRFDANWPLVQVKHLLSLLNASHCSWSDLLFEYVMDCMSKKYLGAR